MKRSIKRCNRPEASFGLAAAIISAVASLASSGIGAMSANKSRQQQQRIQEYNNALASSENINQNIEQSLDNQTELEKQGNVIARKGCRRKLKYGGSSTGGRNQVYLANNVVADAKGNFVEIQPNVFYSNNGPTHEQGGINVDVLTKKGKKPGVNVEGNEVIDLSNRNIINVLSDTLVDPRTGKTYAQNALDGEPANLSSVKQESDKRNGEALIIGNNGKINHYNDKKSDNENRRSIALCGARKKCACGTRRKCACGGRKKALWGWNEEIKNSDLTGGDIYSTGISAFSNLGSGIMNYLAYKNMKAPSAPVLVGRSALPTRYNIDPQLAELENSRYNTIDYINRNTSSSAVARDINNRTNLQYALSANNLHGEKTNKETDMISANIQYQDAGRKEMGKEMSDYLSRVIDFKNDRLAGKVSALTQSMAGLASNVNSLADNVEQRSINRDNAYLTAATAKPEVLAYLESLDPNRFRRLFGAERQRSLNRIRGIYDINRIQIPSKLPISTVDMSELKLKPLMYN